MKTLLWLDDIKMNPDKIFKYIIVIFLFSITFLITDCSMGVSETISGTITEKVYEPERRWTTTTTTIVGKVPVTNTHHHFDDEDWKMYIEGYTKRGKTVKTVKEIQESKFNGLDIGDKWYFNITRGKFTGWIY